MSRQPNLEGASRAGPPAAPEITSTLCAQCGTVVHGVDSRYACPGCGWVNHWSEGSRDLPTAEDDPDYPR
ncbi:hypothetical protein [Streptomyces sp. NPDC086787]|uniref:hypothetical protein n=1 Tax=Streptomyces sp. NPDC086787 TaxID=3365759 RepID=UPI0037F3934A